MLLLSFLLATAPLMDQTAQANDNPFTQTAQPKRTVRRRAPAKRKAARPASNSGGSVYYANCSAARAAGDAPVMRGQPGYSSKLDRDHDGVGCE